MTTRRGISPQPNMKIKMEKKMLSKIKAINHIVAVGSVDGILTSSALLRFIASKDSEHIGLEFTQAFTVDKIDPSGWKPGRKVAFVDLAVNNRNPAITVDFLKRIKASGHEIIAVCDEHSAADWWDTFVEAGLKFDGLAIKPVSQSEGDIKSSGALLLHALCGYADIHTIELCKAADQADRMNFDTYLGGPVNFAVKSDMANNDRRVHMARHFSYHSWPGEKITRWGEAYQSITKNHDKVIAKKLDLGGGFYRINTVGILSDRTALMLSLYSSSSSVVVCENDHPKHQISIGTNKKELNLLEILVEAGVKPYGGFSMLVSISHEDEGAAIGALRGHLSAK